MTRTQLAYLALLTTTLLRCGGTPEPAKEPANHAKARSDADSTRGIGASAEVGALPEEEAQYALKSAFDGIRRCFVKGAERIEFLGGEIAVNVTVGETGAVKSVYAERSTLGDRRTEKCMFEAVRGSTWPKPVGGPIGIAQGAFDFEMTGDVRPPVPWESDRVTETLEHEAEKIASCKPSSGTRYQATVYVGTEGKPLSVGISAPSRDAESASDCLVDVLMQAAFPPPGSWPAKVSFSI